MARIPKVSVGSEPTMLKQPEAATMIVGVLRQRDGLYVVDDRLPMWPIEFNCPFRTVTTRMRDHKFGSSMLDWHRVAVVIEGHRTFHVMVCDVDRCEKPMKGVSPRLQFVTPGDFLPEGVEELMVWPIMNNRKIVMPLYVHVEADPNAFKELLMAPKVYQEQVKQRPRAGVKSTFGYQDKLNKQRQEAVGC